MSNIRWQEIDSELSSNYIRQLGSNLGDLVRSSVLSLSCFVVFLVFNVVLLCWANCDMIDSALKRCWEGEQLEMERERERGRGDGDGRFVFV